MNKLFERFGKLITASFFVMAVGIVLFLLTPLFYGYWGLDTDLIGLIILTTGLAICIIGIILRKKLRGWKLAVLAVLAAIMCLPLLSLVVSSIYFLIMGKPWGS